MDENARKRKREEEESSEIEGIETEKPLRLLKNVEKQAKKRIKGNVKNLGDAEILEKNRNDNKNSLSNNAEALQKSKADKKREKRQSKKAREEAKAAKSRAKKARKEQQAAIEKDTTAADEIGESSAEEDDLSRIGDVNNIDIAGMLDEQPKYPRSTASPSPTPPSPLFDASTMNSGSSSVSSIVPPVTDNNKPQPKKPLDEPAKQKTDPEELKIRLQKRIEELRAARKADGLNGKPARNRQELMEARRRKEEERRAHKKELRQKAKEEERQKQQLIISRGSPLLNPPSSRSLHRNPERTDNFSFGRITFPDGQHASAELSTILPSPKTKGPQDPRTALQAAQNKQSRLNALDPAKQSAIAEKDLWLNARKRAHGETIRDDTSLLKKTLKRKEKTKKKSENEWSARVEGVEKGIAVRQKKREDNLQKRRDGKGKPSGKKAKTKKSKARPGFEGSFRAKPIGGGSRGK